MGLASLSLSFPIHEGRAICQGCPWRGVGELDKDPRVGTCSQIMLLSLVPTQGKGPSLSPGETLLSWRKGKTRVGL